MRRHVHIWYDLLTPRTLAITNHRVYTDPSPASINRLHRVITAYVVNGRGLVRPVLIGDAVGWVWAEKSRW